MWGFSPIISKIAVPVFEHEARVKYSYSSGYIESVYIESVYIESEKAIRDGVSRFLIKS